jgi:hypothetical protein
MEDAMLFPNVRPIAAGFALAALAVTLGTTANSAHAERRKADQQDSRCSERDGCKLQYVGIVQKKRDGVNYFYGGSNLPYGYRDNFYDPVYAPIQVIQYNSNGYPAPCGVKGSRHRVFDPAMGYYNPYPFPAMQCW